MLEAVMLSFPGGEALLFFGEVKRDISTVMIQLRTAGLQWSAFALFGVVSMMCVGCGGNGGSTTPPTVGDFTISASPTSVVA